MNGAWASRPTLPRFPCNRAVGRDVQAPFILPIPKQPRPYSRGLSHIYGGIDSDEENETDMRPCLDRSRSVGGSNLLPGAPAPALFGIGRHASGGWLGAGCISRPVSGLNSRHAIGWIRPI